jgi:hypothetical protein
VSNGDGVGGAGYSGDLRRLWARDAGQAPGPVVGRRVPPRPYIRPGRQCERVHRWRGIELIYCLNKQGRYNGLAAGASVGTAVGVGVGGSVGVASRSIAIVAWALVNPRPPSGM